MEGTDFTLAGYPALVQGPAFAVGICPKSRHYNDEQWRVLAAVLEVLPRLLAHLRLVFGRTGQLDFTEVAPPAPSRRWAMTGADRFSSAALDYQIQHLLVDEFQTAASPSQVGLRRRSPMAGSRGMAAASSVWAMPCSLL